MKQWLGAMLVLAGCRDVRVVGQGGSGQGGEGSGGGPPLACVAGELRLAGEPQTADYEAFHGGGQDTLAAFGSQVMMIGREHIDGGAPYPLVYSIFEPWGEWPVAAPVILTAPRATGEGVGFGISAGAPYLIGSDEDGTFLVPDARDAWASVPLSPLQSFAIYSAANGAVIFSERRAIDEQESYRLRVTNTGSESVDAVTQCTNPYLPRKAAIPLGSDFLTVQFGLGPGDACGMLQLERITPDDLAVAEVTDSFAGGNSVEDLALIPRPGGAWLLYRSYAEPGTDASKVLAVRLDENGVRVDLEPLLVDTPRFLSVIPHGDGFALTGSLDPEDLQRLWVMVFDGDAGLVAEGEIAAPTDELIVYPTGLVSSPDESALLVAYVQADGDLANMVARFARFDCAN